MYPWWLYVLTGEVITKVEDGSICVSQSVAEHLPVKPFETVMVVKGYANKIELNICVIFNYNIFKQ